MNDEITQINTRQPNQENNGAEKKTKRSLNATRSQYAESDRKRQLSMETRRRILIMKRDRFLRNLNYLMFSGIKEISYLRR